MPAGAAQERWGPGPLLCFLGGDSQHSPPVPLGWGHVTFMYSRTAVACAPTVGVPAGNSLGLSSAELGAQGGGDWLPSFRWELALGPWVV